MNNRFHRIAFAWVFITMMVSQVHAQFTTTFAKNATPGQQNGLYYSLPQTMLQLDFVVEESIFEEGPLSDYADNYLETSAYDSYGSTSYALKEVRMTSKATPDPNATFFVSFNVVRGSGKPVFDILPNGIIRSIGVKVGKEETVDYQSETIENKASVTAQISTETPSMMSLMRAGKTTAQMAKEAADKIEEIRKAKFYLISGDVEMATNPETFKTMYAKLDELEQEYMSLFVGKRVTRQTVHKVYVIPNKETPTQTVARFSETSGFTAGTAGSGSAIMVQTLPLNITANINAPSQSAIEAMSYENKVMYRVPETANVKVTCGTETLIEERQVVNQLGMILMAPIQNSTLVFDTETGQIVGLSVK